VIPVLHYGRFGTDPDGFVRDLGVACRETGFFLLTGHGVAPELVADVFAQADRFFAQPDAAKAPLSILSEASNRGWVPAGAEKLDDTGAYADRKKAFNIGLDLAADDPRVLRGEPFRAQNRWPDLPGFADTMRAYFDACLSLGAGLHRAFARDLGLPDEHFVPHFRAPMATLRLLHYPPASGAVGEIGAGTHTDYGSITLLMTDGEAGLQVRPRGGDWTDVPHVPGAYVVNIGDCLMRWTNDIYVSTPHRVLPPRNRRRSVAFFLDPDPDAVIAALPGTGEAKYPAVTGADYLRGRLDATYGTENA
jgi:isopenicillin N synthase-like dioxygenase